MKYTIALHFIICFFSFYSFPQSKYSENQIIQYSNGDSLLLFKIIDFDTDEPLIGVSIYSTTDKTKIGETDINGLFTCNKSLDNRLRFSYTGYEGVCFKLIDSTINEIIIRMKNYSVPDCDLIVTEAEDKFHQDNLDEVEAISDANKDIENNILQLFYRDELTEEQLEFASNYGFNFVDGKDKTWQYTYGYNRVVLYFLSNKHQIIIENRLKDICWFNK